MPRMSMHLPDTQCQRPAGFVWFLLLHGTSHLCGDALIHSAATLQASRLGKAVSRSHAAAVTERAEGRQ